MLKKIVSCFALASLIAGFLPLSAKAIPVEEAYSEPVEAINFNFKANVNLDGDVDLTWDSFIPQNLKFYAIIRSSFREDPLYPEDGYLALVDEFTLNYVDERPLIGTAYYRICAITTDNQRSCSKTATVTKTQSSNDTTEPTTNNPDPTESTTTEETAIETTETATTSEATETTTEVDTSNNFTITLKGEVNANSNRLDWFLANPTGDFGGFKLIRSTVRVNPTLPEQSAQGEIVQFISNQSQRTYNDVELIEGQNVYYYRICKLDNNDSCLGYSNSVMLNREAANVSLSSVGTCSITDECRYDLECGAESYCNVNCLCDSKPTANLFYAQGNTQSEAIIDYIKQNDLIIDVKLKEITLNSVNSAEFVAVCNQKLPDSPCPFPLLETTDSLFSSQEQIVSYLEDFKEDNPDPFSDIESSSYKQAIEYLQAKMIIEGYQDGSFKPKNTINRAEFTKIITAILYSDAEMNACLTQTEALFSDTPKEEWFGKYVCIAKQEGIINGYPDNTFKPAAVINFSEAAKILATALGLPIGEDGDQWFTKYVLALQQGDYIPPSVGALDHQLTREEMSELIWRIREDITDQPNISLIIESGDFDAAEYQGWRAYSNGEVAFYYPEDWHTGTRSNGRIYFSEEKDYIENLETPGYIDVETFFSFYSVNVDPAANDNLALRLDNYFDHPEISSTPLIINSLPALRRVFLAEEGTTVQNRIAQVDEYVVQYTFRSSDKVYVLQFLNASGDPNYNLPEFDKTAKSFSQED